MKSRLAYFLTVALALAVGLYLIWYLSSGTALIGIGTDSPIKNDVTFYLSSDRFTTPLKLPTTKRLPPGNYTVIAVAPGSFGDSQKITIKSGQMVTVSLNPIREVPLGQSTSISPNEATYQLFKQLPFYGDRFVATGIFKADNQTLLLTGISIKFLSSLAEDEPEVLKNQEKQLAQDEANEWLEDTEAVRGLPVMFTNP